MRSDARELSRREFLAIAGAAAALPLVDRIGPVSREPKRIRIKFGDKEPTSVVILPLFHPAAALYNGSMRQTIMDDFAKIPKVLEQIDK